jgi:hypothetical protein
MRKPIAKCYLCGKEEELYFIEFNEWVCKKDRERFNKFFDRLKHKKTRSASVSAYKGLHKLNDYGK